MSLRLACLTLQIPGQPGLHFETLPPNKKGNLPWRCRWRSVSKLSHSGFHNCFDILGQIIVVGKSCLMHCKVLSKVLCYSIHTP